MDSHMKVVICLNNISHANALAKRLVELTDKVSIRIARWDGTSKKRAEIEGDDNDVIVVNDDLDTCVEEVKAIVKTAEHAAYRNLEFIDSVRGELSSLLKGDN